MPTPALEIKRLKVAVLLLTLWLCGCGVIVTPEPPPTPTPFVMQSLFAEDTCAPPCWMGLMPGISSAEDVVALSQNLEDMGSVRVLDGGIVDSNTGYLIDGQYRFSWGMWEREDSERTTNSAIDISNGAITSIYIKMSVYMPLTEAMRHLNTPTQVRFGAINELMYFDLIFFNPPIRIKLWSTYSEGQVDLCEEKSLGEAFWIDSISYFTPIEGIVPRDLVENIGFYNIEVPSDVWEAWSIDDWAINCVTALNALNNMELPYLPTLTPLPTMTIIPTETP
jgi:hypothetical protein